MDNDIVNLDYVAITYQFKIKISSLTRSDCVGSQRPIDILKTTLL